MFAVLGLEKTTQAAQASDRSDEDRKAAQNAGDAAVHSATYPLGPD